MGVMGWIYITANEVNLHNTPPVCQLGPAAALMLSYSDRGKVIHISLTTPSYHTKNGQTSVGLTQEQI